MPPGRLFRLRMEIKRETANESWEHFPVNKVNLYLPSTMNLDTENNLPLDLSPARFLST